MSDGPNHDRDDRGDELREADREPQEEALQRLLSRAERPPAISAAARRRIGERLEAAAAQRRPGSEVKRFGLGTLVGALWRRRRAISTGVSALALAAAATLVIYWMQQSSETIHRNEGTGPRAILLADGTRAILDEGTELRSTARRTLRLERGRVLLDVHREAEPLVVESRHGRVTAVGTRLLVEQDEQRTRAAVVRGEVRLEGASQGELLRAGEAGILRRGEPPERKRAQRLSYLTGFAREAMGLTPQLLDAPVRRGGLVARAPGWDREWPLPLRRLKVDVHVEDGVVRTTLDQTFFNRVNQRLEGRYTFPLPPDAAVARLAMYVDGELVEGGIVERQRGREIYESIVYLQRDPALLEWMAGNTFRTRIFPLEPRQTKRIVLSYTEPLERRYDTYRLAVPIPELDEAVGEVDYEVRVVGGGYQLSSRNHPLTVGLEQGDRVGRFVARDHVVGADLVVALRDEQPAPVEIHRYDDGAQRYLIARVMPELEEPPGPPPKRSWVVLIDTSASRSPLELRAQAYVARRLVAEIDEGEPVVLLAFDSSVRSWSPGWLAAGAADDRTVERFLDEEASQALGETDLAAALAQATSWLDRRDETDGDQPTIVVLGDGMATGAHGETTAVPKLLEHGAQVIGVAIGDRVDAAVLEALADETGGQFAHWDTGDDLGWKTFDLVAGLRTPRLTALTARLQGPDGKPLEDTTAYLASRQLGGGEMANVLARWPAKEPPPQALLLAGRRGGSGGRRPCRSPPRPPTPPTCPGSGPNVVSRRSAGRGWQRTRTRSRPSAWSISWSRPSPPSSCSRPRRCFAISTCVALAMTAGRPTRRRRRSRWRRNLSRASRWPGATRGRC